jgi:hypothetical protein
MDEALPSANDGLELAQGEDAVGKGNYNVIGSNLLSSPVRQGRDSINEPLDYLEGQSHLFDCGESIPC